MREDQLGEKFPRLRDGHLRITSPATSAYNCIAWAAGDEARRWSPDPFPEGLFAWPEGAPKEDTLAAWVAAFGTLGYAPCDDGGLEPGFEKVAIYARDGTAPQHAARQLPSGRWTSKLGTIEDVEHDLDGLVGERYGDIVVFLKRARQDE